MILLMYFINNLIFFPVNNIQDWDISHKYGDGMNTLGLVVFGIVLGIALSKMGEQGKILLSFFDALSEATMLITKWVIW